VEILRNIIFKEKHFVKENGEIFWKLTGCSLS
jgi:hypothetical protein